MEAHPVLAIILHECRIVELAAREGPQRQRHPALAVRELRSRAKVPDAGAIPDPARRREVRHEQRVDERVIRRLEPHGDLRPEVLAPH